MNAKRLLALGAGLCMCQVLVLWPGSSRAEDFSNAAMRSIELSYTVTVPDIPEGALQVDCWIPLPQSDAHQTVQGYTVHGDFEYEEVIENEFGNHFLQFDLSPAAGGAAEFSVVFSVDRQRVDETNLFSGDNSPEMIRRFLPPASMVPLDGPIAAEATAVASKESDPLARAHALYANIVNTVTYDKPQGGKHGRGDALFACDERYGNCTDFHSLFIGEARSLGIPARFHMGIPVAMNADSGEIGGYHCWAEFWIDGRGWVPIDASEAQKNKARTDELFGGLDASRIRFATGRDILIPGSATGRVNFIIYPLVEADGEQIPANRNFSFTAS